MSGNFEWHTEDKWDQFEQSAEPPEPPRRNRWVWLAGILIGVVALIAGGIVVTRNMTERAEEVTAFTEENVRASFRLIEHAAASNDLELFNSMLSGRDEAWTAAQQRLFIEDTLFDRSALSLHLGAEPGTITGVELSPELRSAELTSAMPYTIAVGNGVTATTTLEQTFIFRRGTNNFILAPPEEPFWGEQQTLESPRLALSFRSADAAIAADLFNDLDTLILQFCESFYNPTCGNRLPFNITLSVDPGTLVDMNTLEAFLAKNQNAFALPSPTLIGRPADDLGYDALLSAYMEQIVAGVMADIVVYECCAHVAYFQGIVDRQMVELGLQPPSLSAETYQALVNADFPFEENETIWTITAERDITPAQKRLVAATLEYIFDRDSTLGLLDLLSVMQTAGASFRSWQSQLLPVDSLTDRFDQIEVIEEADWQRFVIEQAGLDLMNALEPLPAGELLLACPGEAGSTLYTLDLQNPEWRTMLTSKYETIGVFPLADGSATLLYELSEQPAWRISVVENDVVKTINAGEGDPDDRFWLFGDVDGDILVVIPFDIRTLSNSGQSPQADAVPSLLDWRACAAGTCDLIPVGGIPVWNPSQTRAVVAVEQTNEVRIIDRQGTLIDTLPDSTLPAQVVWTADDVFVYATQEMALASYRLDDRSSSALVAADDLMAQVLPDQLTTGWVIDALLGVPDTPSDLIVLLQNPDTRRSNVIRYRTEATAESTTLLYEADGLLWLNNEPFSPRVSAVFSADNHALIFIAPPPGPRGTDLDVVVLDVESGDAATSSATFLTQWIGNWLASSDGHHLRLLLPELGNRSGFQQFIPLPETGCETLSWTQG